MNGKDLKYISIKTMSIAEAVFKSFLITVEARDFGTIMNLGSWPSGTRLSDFRMSHGGLRINGADKLKIGSYNYRGFNAYNVSFISELLNMCDILLLHETWLYSSQCCVFTTYFNNYNNVNICGMDKSVLHAGRPYGGCTILYNSSSTDIYILYI